MIHGDDGHDDQIMIMIIMVLMSSMVIMIMISVKGWREHQRNHESKAMMVMTIK